MGIAANAFRFVTFDNLLEVDTGMTSNEPGLLALRQAVEKSVYALVMEGSEIGLWDFKDKNSGLALLSEYRSERDGVKNKITSSNLASTKKPAVKNTSVNNQTVEQTAVKAAVSVPAPAAVEAKAEKQTQTQAPLDTQPNHDDLDELFQLVMLASKDPAPQKEAERVN